MLPQDLRLNRPIWIHAVSVGEAIAVRCLIEELRTAYPGKRFFISTVTATGNKIARGIAKETDFAAYLPLDLSFIVRRVVNKINPWLFVAAETEIWPNLISSLHQKNIPIAVVNARISDRSFKGYLRVKPLLKPVLDKVNFFCVQTDSDAKRLLRLGVLKNRIQVTGNMKFDIAHYTDVKAGEYRTKLGLRDKEKILVAGSTHPSEEKILLGVYKKLLKEFPDLRLLIAPRHPERSRDVEKIVVKYGFNSLKVSQLTSERVSRLNNLTGTPAYRQMVRQAHHSSNHPERSRGTGKPEQANGSTGSPFLEPSRAKPRNRQTIFILDTVGQLMSFYNLADIVFVGGSLVKKGGHNILEPAAKGKPVIFGPYMFNFRDIAGLFLKNKAALSVNNTEELEMSVRDLLNNPHRMAELGQAAKTLVLQNQGATERNLECIKRCLAG